MDFPVPLPAPLQNCSLHFLNRSSSSRTQICRLMGRLVSKGASKTVSISIGREGLLKSKVLHDLMSAADPRPAERTQCCYRASVQISLCACVRVCVHACTCVCGGGGLPDYKLQASQWTWPAFLVIVSELLSLYWGELQKLDLKVDPEQFFSLFIYISPPSLAHIDKPLQQRKEKQP